MAVGAGSALVRSSPLGVRADPTSLGVLMDVLLACVTRSVALMP
jgi:hypothetical protein